MRHFVTLVTLWLRILQLSCHEIFLDFVKLQDEQLEITSSKKCVSDLKEIKKGLAGNELWALSILDTSGKTPPGIIGGNNFWLGRENECNLINNPEMASKVNVEYRMIYATHTSQIQFDTKLTKPGLTIGLCLPKDCNDADISAMSENIFKSSFWQNHPIIGNVSLLRTKKLKLREHFYRERSVVILM